MAKTTRNKVAFKLGIHRSTLFDLEKRGAPVAAALDDSDATFAALYDWTRQCCPKIREDNCMQLHQAPF